MTRSALNTFSPPFSPPASEFSRQLNCSWVSWGWACSSGRRAIRRLTVGLSTAVLLRTSVSRSPSIACVIRLITVVRSGRLRDVRKGNSSGRPLLPLWVPHRCPTAWYIIAILRRDVVQRSAHRVLRTLLLLALCEPTRKLHDTKARATDEACDNESKTEAREADRKLHRHWRRVSNLYIVHKIEAHAERRYQRATWFRSSDSLTR
jgi:hypothetical protein